MKVIALGLVLGLAAAVTASNICTGRNDGDQLPNPTDCASFYVCNLGEPKLFKCVNNLLYDPSKQVCNWAYMVTCFQLQTQELPPSKPHPQYTTNHPQHQNNTPYTGHPPELIEVPPIPDYSEFFPGLVESRPNVFYCTNPEFYFAPHPRNCEKYFICENYRIHHHQCSKGIHWDFEKQVCDLPMKTSCFSGSNSSEEQEYENGNVETTFVVCNGTQTFIAHSGDCRKYYICTGDIPIATSCPRKMAWDETASQCNEKAWSKCFA